jgi:hypothetical protein
MWNKEREAVISVMKEDAKWVVEPAKNFRTELREVLEVVRTNPTAIVAGGCFADIFRGLSFKDLDLWYRTPNDWDSVVSKVNYPPTPEAMWRASGVIAPTNVGSSP